MLLSVGIASTDVEATYALIRPLIRRTPVVEVSGADFGLQAFPLTFKLEQLQHAGSFKTRGAFANLLLRDVPKVGVAAASGGNHGAAVAYAAMRRGVPARIFVPTVSSAAKISRIRGYGADLVVGGDRYADALAASGGGGLIGGIAAWYAGRVKIVGVEPEGAPTLTEALRAGRPVDANAGSIAADSLAPRRVGELMFPIAQAYVDRVVLVSDTAIRAAQNALWSTLRLVAEPGAAAALAGILSGAYEPGAGERVGVVISGANTTAVD